MPSTTTSKRRTTEAALTQRYARNLRVLLERLDTIHAERAQIVRRAENRAQDDDIRERIQKAASTTKNNLADMPPAMFENILEEELEKYDQFYEMLKDNEQEQEDILSAIEVSLYGIHLYMKLIRVRRIMRGSCLRGRKILQ